MKPQVDKQHYEFTRYTGPDRWSSYYSQLCETLALSPRYVLEIGPGDGFYGKCLSTISTIKYRSLDIDKELNPDIVCSVLSIPLPDESVECVVAFEILEHLPFDDFPIALKELARVSSKNVILSLPHFGPPVKVLIKLPFFSEMKLAFKIPYFRAHKFNGQHYWEIGKLGYPVSRIITDIEQAFVVERHVIPFENQYH